MNASGCECTVFDASALLPEEWRGMAERGPVRTFNPAILRDAAGWIMAYRVVGPDGHRRLAVCRLDPALRIIAGSPVPLSDAIRLAGARSYPDVIHQWQADPRLYRVGERLFIYWNSGWHEPQNHQFLQELDPASFTPKGPPRELRLHGDRQPIEKNWTFFEDAGSRLRCIYSVVPHRVLGFSLVGTGDIEFREVACTTWSLEGYPPSHGGLRGGAPPVWHDGRFWSFCHTVHDGTAGYRYAVAVYCFSHEPGFPPVASP
ncbi:MAG: hypothetical protein FJ399_17925, partial [Verrucomicrobia bacterium]|nr:hypothetical protein [Verrucomicrobiota bacterium]